MGLQTFFSPKNQGHVIYELFVISTLFYDILFVYEVCQINSIQFNSTPGY